MTLDPEPAADDPDGEADFAAGDGLEDEHGVAGYQDEVDFLVENVCVDSDFAFFDDIWQTRRKAKKEAEKKAEKEKAEKKEKVDDVKMKDFCIEALHKNEVAQEMKKR